MPKASYPLLPSPPSPKTCFRGFWTKGAGGAFFLNFSQRFGSLFELCRQSKNFICRNCNCYPHLFRCCSTIKISCYFPQPISRFMKNLSVALLFLHTLFSFQGAARRKKLRFTRFGLWPKFATLRSFSFPKRIRFAGFRFEWDEDAFLFSSLV